MNSPIQIWRSHKTLYKSLGKTGKIITWTRIYSPPAGFEREAPYIVAIVEFEDGTKRTLQLVDCDKKHLRTGQKVTSVIRRIGKVAPDSVIEYGLKVKPL